MKALWVSRSWHDRRDALRQHIGVGRCLVFSEIRMFKTEGGGPWTTTHLRELSLSPPSPPVPLKPLATLTYLNMWSPGIRGHRCFPVLNAPPAFPGNTTYLWKDLKRCVSSGEGEIAKKADKGDGGFHFHRWLGTWWHRVWTRSGHGHVDQESRLPQRKQQYLCFTILSPYDF